MTDSLIFSIVETRPDIVFATSIASCFTKNPGHQHTKAIKTILQYLKGLQERGITYGGQSELLVEGYSDSDWARDNKSRKSISSFIFMLNKGPISSSSKSQPIVALSSTQAEYIALTLATKQATWLRLLLTKLGLLQLNEQYALIKVSQNNTCTQRIYENLSIAYGKEETNVREIIIPLKSNNQESIVLAHNPVFYFRIKHIDI